MALNEDHSERGHSGIGPSAAHRWMACPGSVAMSKELFKKHPELANATNPASREGTMAHELSEEMLENPDFEVETWLKEVNNPEDFNLIEMINHCQTFMEYIHTIACDDDDIILSERRLDMPAIHDDSYGTGDVTIIKPSTKTVHVIDLKYGAGIYVEVINNVQALCYAEGTRHLLTSGEIFEKMSWEPEEYVIHIYQPRSIPVNINEWSVSRSRLREFVKDAHAAAKLTELPLKEAVLNPGEKQCQWCPCNGDCSALDSYMYESNMVMFDDLDNESTDEDIMNSIAETIQKVKSDSNFLTPQRKGQLLKLFPIMTSYMDAVKTSALADAMEGNPPEGFKLVAGRNSYECNDLDALEFLVGENVYKPKQSRSRSDLQKLLGVQFRELGVDEHFDIRPGNPTLAKESDKREALPPPNQTAVDEFDDLT